MADLMKQLTGAQTGGTIGKYMIDDNNYIQPSTAEYTGTEYDTMDDAIKAGGKIPTGGRRRRHSKHHKGNSWLAHVKATMKLNRGKSFKQVLKLAKKSYKKSQSQSGGRKRRSCKGQNGGSGGKVAGVGASASPYV